MPGYTRRKPGRVQVTGVGRPGEGLCDGSYTDALLQELRTAGLTDRHILDAFAYVPRHLFVESWLERGPGGWMRRETTDADSLRAVYTDRALVLEVRNDLPVSSTSQPSLIGAVLRALDVRSGMNVLEVGCGVGYSTALLARLVGSEGRVTAVDVAPEAVARAQEIHRRLGLKTRFAVLDGYYGLKEAGPFDRIVVYVGIADVSPLWFEQLTPDGFILAPIDHCVDTPYLRILPDRTATVVMWSAFIPATGRLGWTDERPSPWMRGRVPAVTSSPLVVEETWQVDSSSFWFYLTFKEGHRLTRLGGYSLVGNRSYVSWDDARVRAFGDVAEATALLAEVKALLADFEQIGAPKATSVAVQFENLPPTDGRLRIPRLYHYEVAAFR